MESSVVVVADTNIFLHCKALVELPWDLIATETVEILLVDPVLAELDHWKDQGNDRRAKRVRALLPMLRKLVADGHDVVDVAAGPPRVRLQLDSRTFVRSWEDNDGAIIDAAQAIQTQGCSPVLVLTRDVLLAARCKRRGVTFMLLSPDDARWNAEPERPDPTLSEVRRELEELK